MTPYGITSKLANKNVEDDNLSDLQLNYIKNSHIKQRIYFL